MEKHFNGDFSKKQRLIHSLLFILGLIVPSTSFAQGQENALAFFGIILHIAIIVFIILPLTFLFYKRKKTGRILFSVFIYLWTVPSLAWLGYASYDSIFDPYESMDKWGYLILCYFLAVLIFLILTLKKDIEK
jgi:hypothetical protein